MDAFEEIDDDECQYTNVVQYFFNIDGFNVKETVNLYLKESMLDNLALSFTWLDNLALSFTNPRKGGLPLYKIRLVKLIYDAVCKNKYFPKPTRSEFQRHMIEALRAAKERVRFRNKPRGERVLVARENDRDFWNADDTQSTDED
ncbi:uncharacterized protein LOC116852205 isoform X2 [Odontomachus brunneus]|uniref:uncharacterized protein LOC116852203 isoform X2 n=1 Tax=Odontomachus brunneus TaxID=486640 RepID=UPI0013F1F087|nr:uncharacterized protein LOC116852203 isoform X2 [Odontomachus brunneus]XP_032688208.1 uncharacterized protein LOC116852205 isoform X2 [Odontomachus brunneus]